MLSQPTKPNSRMTGGAILIAIGVLAILGQIIRNEHFGALTILALGIVFLVTGVLSHKPGLIIPGGILSGVGTGATLILFTGHLSPETQGAIMLLSMAAGFAIITPLAAFVDCQTHWWSLIVAGGLAIVGGALLLGGSALEILKLASYVWPLILIGIGVSIILRQR